MVYTFIVVCSYAIAATSFGAGLMRLLLGSWQAPSDVTSDSRSGEGISAAALTGSAFLLGQGVLSQLWVVLAVCGWFRPEIVCGVIVLAGLSGLRWVIAPARAFAMTLVLELRRLRQERWSWRALAGCCLAVVVLSGAEGLLIPVPGGKDAVANYMPLAKLTAATHQLMPLPGGKVYSGGIAKLGLVGEMHWAALMSLGMGGASKAFSWPIGLAGTVMLLGLGSAAGIGRRGQWILVAMVWTSSTILVHVWDGKVDLFGAAVGVAAYYWGLRASGDDARQGVGGLCMVGLFTALAVLAKLTLLVAMVPGLVLLLVWRTLIRAQGPHVSLGSILKSVLVFAASGFAILVPQLVKNAVLFGEPLAPIYYVQPPQASDLDGSALTMGDAYYIFSIYPLALAFGRFTNMGWNLSPLVLVALPLAANLPRPRSLARSSLFQLTVTGVVGIVAWHWFRPSVFMPRYTLPTLLLFTLAGAAAGEHISLQAYRRRLLSGVFMFCLLFGLLFQVRDFLVNDNLFQVVKNELRRRPNYPINAEFYLASEVVNQDAGVGDRVLLGMHDIYWLRADLIRTTGYAISPALSLPEEALPAERWLAAYNQGYRYVLLETNTLSGKDLAAELGIMPDGCVNAPPSSLCIEKLYHEGKCTVLRMRAAH